MEGESEPSLSGDTTAESPGGGGGSGGGGGELSYEATELTLALPGSAAGSAAAAERKRGFACKMAAQPDSDSLSSSASAAGAGESLPAPKARVVGWPPVRSSRRNLMVQSGKLVKVAVDGVPYLRKVDLMAYNGYETLMSALQEIMWLSGDYLKEDRRLVDPVDGTEYVPTYEDRDGDWMLVGDVPWKMFIESCQRIRLMKSSEAVNLAPRVNFAQ